MPNGVPEHLGIIMDGNRRWAREHGLPSLQGHKVGYEKIKIVGDWCLDRGVRILTVYAFSTENWNRSKREVSYLMRLLRLGLQRDVKEMHRKGIQVRVIGRIQELAKELQNAINRAMELTAENTRGILNIAINYGGRPEIVDAIRSIVAHRYSTREVTENLINRQLYTAGLPDPDFIIRTSGEQRLSNFLTWQSAYSELYFIEKHWPAFTEKDFNLALAEYARRERRFGH